MTTNTTTKFLIVPEQQHEWSCYMFGNKPGGAGMVYIPAKGQVLNWFVRWMMKICFECMWVENKEKTV